MAEITSLCKLACACMCINMWREMVGRLRGVLEALYVLLKAVSVVPQVIVAWNTHRCVL